MILGITAFLALALPLLPSACAAPTLDCDAEAKILNQAQSELPRLDVASPADRPPYCITLETIMTFARRLQAHAARCPNSELAAGVAEWTKTQTSYSRLFVRHRCKRTMRGTKNDRNGAPAG
ncbi:MAG TPA: hypothetical protein VH678_02135 [Xanthobacteraceae bacterium]